MLAACAGHGADDAGSGGAMAASGGCDRDHRGARRLARAVAPSGLYPWLKAAHVIAIIAWMAGMLYLPRLFVYHCEAEPGSKQSETSKSWSAGC